MLFRVVVVLVLLGVTVYALVDCLRTDGPDLRLLPKPVWLLLIVLLPIAGSVLYLAVGRATDEAPGPVARPLAPDDDPDFLRRLDIERRRLVAEEELGGGATGGRAPPAAGPPTARATPRATVRARAGLTATTTPVTRPDGG